ncbi:MAG TPA: hypothetical protein VM282_13225 [Acidimicrobiales bacterium]|nr:hypothetical protein [Acidimicrobiales bacterium]
MKSSTPARGAGLGPAPGKGSRTWTLILAGPVIGYGYFWVAYLVAELSCADDPDLLPLSAIKIVTFVGAALAGGATVLFALLAQRRYAKSRGNFRGPDDYESEEVRVDDEAQRQNGRFVAITSLMLLGMFTVFVIFVAAPVAGSSLC